MREFGYYSSSIREKLFRPQNQGNGQNFGTQESYWAIFCLKRELAMNSKGLKNKLKPGQKLLI